jgi:hypothetical protein
MGDLWSVQVRGLIRTMQHHSWTILIGFTKTTCQRHCFSTLNHTLAYCYNDARVIKRLWSSMTKNKFPGAVPSFEY